MEPKGAEPANSANLFGHRWEMVPWIMPGGGTLEGATSTPQWYAVRTRSNHEAVAAGRIAAKGLQAYLPELVVPSRRRDRKRTVTRPLFPGYFFVHLIFSSPNRIDVLRAPGVLAILGSSGGPVPVPEWQVRSIRIALASREPVQVMLGLVPGNRVRIVAGPFTGMEGVIVTAPDGEHTMVIAVELLNRSLSVKLSSYDVEIVE
jgi:transcription termination/antitermination protein NusG